MSVIRIEKHEHPYVIIDNRALEDTRLSWKAKGVLAYLLTKSKDWQIYIAELVQRATDGETAVASALRELKAAGYAKLETVKEEGTGKILGKRWVIFEVPARVTEGTQPIPGFSQRRLKPTHGKPPATKEGKNKDNEEAKASSLAQALGEGAGEEIPAEEMADLQAQYEKALAEESQGRQPGKESQAAQWAAALPAMYAILKREFSDWNLRAAPARNQNMRKFWRANGRDAEALKKLCAKIKASDYLMGRGAFAALSNRPRLDANWIFQPEKAAKIMAEDYANERMQFAIEAAPAKVAMAEVLVVGHGRKKIPAAELGVKWLELGTDAATGLKKVIQKGDSK